MKDGRRQWEETRVQEGPGYHPDAQDRWLKWMSGRLGALENHGSSEARGIKMGMPTVLGFVDRQIGSLCGGRGGTDDHMATQRG